MYIPWGEELCSLHNQVKRNQQQLIYHLPSKEIRLNLQHLLSPSCLVESLSPTILKISQCQYSSVDKALIRSKVSLLTITNNWLKNIVFTWFHNLITLSYISLIPDRKCCNKKRIVVLTNQDLTIFVKSPPTQETKQKCIKKDHKVSVFPRFFEHDKTVITYSVKILIWV